MSHYAIIGARGRELDELEEVASNFLMLYAVSPYTEVERFSVSLEFFVPIPLQVWYRIGESESRTEGAVFEVPFVGSVTTAQAPGYERGQRNSVAFSTCFGSFTKCGCLERWISFSSTYFRH